MSVQKTNKQSFSLVRSLLLVAVMTLSCVGRVSAQIPCRYELAHSIQGPDCGDFGPADAIGTGISPNGRYVVGYYAPCGIGNNRAFIFDTQTEQFRTLPHPPGVTISWAYGVNDTPWVVGHMGGSIDVGFVYDFNAGQYLALIPPRVLPTIALSAKSRGFDSRVRPSCV